MTMSPLYPRGKPRSTGTHNETVKNLVLFLHHAPFMIERLLQLYWTVTPQKKNCDKCHVKQRLVDETWFESKEESSLYLVNANMFLRQKHTREIFN